MNKDFMTGAGSVVSLEILQGSISNGTLNTILQIIVAMLTIYKLYLAEKYGLNPFANFVKNKVKKTDKDNNMKNLIILLITVPLLLPSCTTASNFTRFAVRTGFNILEESGQFEPKEYSIKKKFTGDTLFYYDGINQYLLTKEDSTFKILIVPNRKNLEDTIRHYLKKLSKKNKNSKTKNKNAMRILRKGSYGSDVQKLQKALKDKGHLISKDARFGEETHGILWAYQAQNKLTPDGVAGHKTLTSLNLIPKPSDNDPKFLVVHITATKANSSLTPKDVVNYHIHTLKWGRSGYSRIIDWDGKIHKTWKIDLSDGLQPFEMTYGVGRFINPVSVNICMMGGLDEYGRPKDTRTKKQKASLEQLIKEIVIECPEIKVAGHHQFSNKACPCMSVPDFCREIGIKDENIYTADPFGHVERWSI